MSDRTSITLLYVSGEGGYVVCYEMADIERYLGFGRNSLVRASIEISFNICVYRCISNPFSFNEFDYYMTLYVEFFG